MKESSPDCVLQETEQKEEEGKQDLSGPGRNHEGRGGRYDEASGCGCRDWVHQRPTYLPD